VPSDLPTIAHVDSETGFSGGEVQVTLLIEGLARLGARNVLFSPPGSRCEAWAREHGLDHVAVAMRNDLDGAAVLGLRRGFVRHSIGLAHLHTGRATWLGGWAARLAGVPAITTRRMDRTVRRGMRTRLVHETLCARTVAISPAVRACLIEGGVPPDRIDLVWSAVDPRALVARRPREVTRDELGARAGDVVLLSLAGLVRRKGLDVLLEALAELASDQVVAITWVAGEGPERAALDARAVELGLAGRVRFLGARNDAAELLSACDVFVLPARREGLGVAALEAMAAARPVVASRVGGLAEAVVDGSTGLLVPPEDPRALASALRRVVLDPALRARLGAAGPRRIDAGFRADQMVESYARIYREVLAEVAVA
jgi:glycosyltransferase involved in cell wall biosynthesis